MESTPKGIEYRGFHVAVAIFPIGIDVDQVSRVCKEPSVEPKIAAIREMYQGKKIIIGRDKLDQIKGVQHKLNAFAKFLEEYPEWQDRVSLCYQQCVKAWLGCLDPSYITDRSWVDQIGNESV